MHTSRWALPPVVQVQSLHWSQVPGGKVLPLLSSHTGVSGSFLYLFVGSCGLRALPSVRPYVCSQELLHVGGEWAFSTTSVCVTVCGFKS